MDFIAFLSDNSNGVFALAGALSTGLITLGTTWIQRRQDHSLKLWEKIAERRIQAHERLLESALELRVMIGLGRLDENQEPLRTPYIMLSHEHFTSWFTKFSAGSVSGSSWQTTEAKREANFVQDYMTTLYQTISEVPSDLVPNVGLIIRQDIINLSTSLEKKVMLYFENDIRKLKLSSLAKWHKYKLKQTIARLNSTELMRNQEAISTSSHPVMAEPLLPREDKQEG